MTGIPDAFVIAKIQLFRHVYRTAGNQGRACILPWNVQRRASPGFPWLALGGTARPGVYVQKDVACFPRTDFYSATY